MIELEFVPDLCLYHRPCIDGRAAAAVVARAFPACELLPVNYGSPVPVSLRGRRVLVVDFCPHYETLEAWTSAADALMVLDHHTPRFEHPRLIVDVARSGASLAWDILFKDPQGVRRPWLVRHVHDYDLWGRADSNTAAVIAALDSYSLDDRRWAGWAEDDAGECLPGLLVEGAACLRGQEARAAAVKASFLRRSEFLGFPNILTINLSSADKALINFLGDDLGKHEPFVVFWAVDAAGRYRYSLRASSDSPSRIDVACLAATLGGGGHPCSAGAITRREPRAANSVAAYWRDTWQHLSPHKRLVAAEKWFTNNKDVL